MSKRSVATIETNSFKTILENAKDEQFQSFEYLHSTYGDSLDSKSHKPRYFPNIVEVMTHLKLLKSFQILKMKVISPSHDKEYNVKEWQVFLTDAVRRFVIFVTRLKFKFGNLGENVSEESLVTEGLYKDISFTAFMSEMIPPLDVIMVWHSFLLNPTSMYDVFTREEFLKFAFLPLPLHLINRFIDNDTFQYQVPESFQSNYLSLTNEEQFDVSNFSMYENLVEIYCPKCQTKLTHQFPLSNDSNSGFADADFEIENIHVKSDCFHSQLKTLNHDKLRMLQLYADVFRTGPLQGTFKYFSKIICAPRYYKRDPLEIAEYTRREIKENWHIYNHLPFNEMIERHLKLSRHIRNRKRDLIYLNLYSQFNLISCTVEQSIEIGEDLVGCVLRQERFVEKMNQFNWLQSPFAIDGVNESITRYQRFFKLLTDFNQNILVPTLDIDLIWHTHQLSMIGYFKDCKSSACSSVIDHNDKIEENVLGKNFEYTSKLYKSKYKQPYSLCFCWFCTSKRAGKRDKFKQMFNLKKNESGFLQNPLVSNLELENLTHISGHNAVRLSTTKSKEQSEKNRYPWTTDSTYMMYGNPALFIIPPVFPIYYDNCSFANQSSLCCTVQASCTTQQGACAAIGTSCGGFAPGPTSNFICGNGPTCGGGGTGNTYSGCGGGGGAACGGGGGGGGGF